MAIKNGEIADADEVMNAFGYNFNDTAQMIFNADYIGFDSRLTSSSLPDLNNVYFSTFQTDNAISKDGFLYDSVKDIYTVVNFDAISVYVIIEATSLSGEWASNDCLSTIIGDGKWLLYCTSGTDEVKRAQIMKSLFFGTSGGNAFINDFTSVTALKTTTTRDVGKRAIKVQVNLSGSGSGFWEDISITFTNTTTNLNCSTWSNFSNTADSQSDGTWRIPEGTIRHSFYDPSGGGGSSSNEIGTDLTGDELNNPATAAVKQFTAAGSGPGNVATTVLILCEGTITIEQDTPNDDGSYSFIDYNVDNSIPDMTLSGSLSTEAQALMTVGTETDVGENITNFIPIVNGTGTFSITASNDGTNWAAATNREIFRPTTTGQKPQIRIAITDTENGLLTMISSESSPTLHGYVMTGTGWDGIGFTGETWSVDESVHSGISAYNFGSPEVFQMDGKWYCIRGMDDGGWAGFNWNGLIWESDSGIVTGLTDYLNRSNGTYFEINGTSHFIAGDSSGLCYGYTWNGTDWDADSNVVSGIADVGDYSFPSAFYIDSSLYVIIGGHNDTHLGYLWNGSSWDSNATVVSGLSLKGTASPSTFYYNDQLYLMEGSDDGKYYGFIWNGSGWTVDTDITDSLPDEGSGSSPTIFQMQEGYISEVAIKYNLY